ncbi:MAG: ATP-binding cassette domain-containing protein [Planctomycetota bacterium]
MATLELHNVCKRYGDTAALDSVDLNLDAGKTYVLVGASGCGKSTLLKASIGLVELDAGEVRIDGEGLTQRSSEKLRQRVGYVIQEGGLFPHLTARQNIGLVASYLRWDPQKLNSRVAELAELTRLDASQLDRFPAQLSGGQRQRVGLMRSLVLAPTLLLLDEPLGALDPIIRSELQSDLREIFRRLGKTVVMVTHDLHEAAYFADEILLLNEGRVLQRGSIDDLIDRPADPFVSKFVNAQRSTLREDRA